MPTPTPADCIEAMLRVVSEVDDQEERDRALSEIAEAAADPVKMQELLGGEEEEAPPETEADEALVEGPQEEPAGESSLYAAVGPIQYERSLAELVNEAARDADPNPSEDQKKAGNYRKGHVSIQGLPITIENARGSERSGKNKSGVAWSVKMAHHYGYIKRTESEADGDHIDVFIGPDPESEIVFVIDQQHPGGRFDEHKCMLGFKSEADARKGYLDCYSPGWDGMGGVTAMTMNQFKHWVENGDSGARTEGTSPVLYAAEPEEELEDLPPEWEALYNAAYAETGDVHLSADLATHILEEDAEEAAAVPAEKRGQTEPQTAPTTGNLATSTAVPTPESLDRPEVVEKVKDLFGALGIPMDEEQARATVEEAKEALRPKAEESPMKKRFLALADRAERDGDPHSAKIYRSQAAEAK